nr:hypothetical protein [Acidobacteriota bacterium]
PSGYLEDGARAVRDRLSELTGVDVIGTAPVSPLGDMLTTFVRLRFRSGTEPWRVVWSFGRLVDLLAGTPLPAMTFRPRTTSRFVGYDLLRRQEIDLRFARNGQEMVVRSRHGEVIARRLEHHPR